MARWLIFAVLGVLSTSAVAATVDVTISGFSFSPREVRIQAGDTVRWTNGTGVPHDVVADDNSFNSGISANFTFQRTFNSAGEFGYFCSLHGSPGQGMFGRVIVQGASTPTGPAIAPYVAGSWYNPATTGQGFLVEASTAPAIFAYAWFTWAADGRADWYTGNSGSSGLNGNRADVNILRVTGGRFNDPAPVQQIQAGTGSFILTSCTTAEFRYTLTNPALGSGTIPLQKILPAGVGCVNPPGVKAPQR